VHLVGFIVRICHDARSPERQDFSVSSNSCLVEHSHFTIDHGLVWTSIEISQIIMNRLSTVRTDWNVLPFHVIPPPPRKAEKLTPNPCNFACCLFFFNKILNKK